jgi:hypothetical protein
MIAKFTRRRVNTPPKGVLVTGYYFEHTATGWRQVLLYTDGTEVPMLVQHGTPPKRCKSVYHGGKR